MEKSPVNQIFLLFKSCFEQLSVEISIKEIEELTLLVHHCMSGPNRAFHNSEHILNVANPFVNPYQILAALFHDVIYYQIDRGFPLETKAVLDNYVAIRRDEVVIRFETQEDLSFDMCLAVFGFERGQVLSPFKGLNEFLSAFVAAKSLEKYLAKNAILYIITCIEATIPFGGIDENGKTHFENLEERLLHFNQAINLNLDDSEIEEMVKAGVEVANQDVINFSDEKVGRFLGNTWALISESNSHLSNIESYAYDITSYRQGMQKTEMFLNNLNPDHVFHEHKHVPNIIEYERLRQQAHRNIAIAREYMAAKLLNAAILESLAMCTGGDIPLSMFTGGARNRTKIAIERAEDHLPKVILNNDLDYDEMVSRLLEFGRMGKTTFDMNHSPLSAFVYKSLGSTKVLKYFQEAKKLFDGEISHRDFLKSIDHSLVSAIARACAHIALSRSELLEEFF